MQRAATAPAARRVVAVPAGRAPTSRPSRRAAVSVVSYLTEHAPVSYKELSVGALRIGAAIPADRDSPATDWPVSDSIQSACPNCSV